MLELERMQGLHQMNAYGGTVSADDLRKRRHDSFAHNSGGEATGRNGFFCGHIFLWELMVGARPLRSDIVDVNSTQHPQIFPGR